MSNNFEFTAFNEFTYTIYIRSTPKEAWEAIITPEITKQFWGYINVSSWKKGSQWQHISNNNVIELAGEIIEITPESLLVFTWTDFNDVTNSSRVAIEITPIDDAVRLNITHNNFKNGSRMFDDIKIGWPMVLSSMKSFLETGKALKTWG